MTDKPEIKVGQRWVTRCGDIVRILATDGRAKDCPVITEDDLGNVTCVRPDGFAEKNAVTEIDLISLVPSTVKRGVALYRDGEHVLHVEFACNEPGHAMTRISEYTNVEFTLLPGESAE